MKLNIKKLKEVEKQWAWVWFQDVYENNKTEWTKEDDIMAETISMLIAKEIKNIEFINKFKHYDETIGD